MSLPSETLIATQTAQEETVLRSAFWLPGRSSPLFAWLHRRPDAIGHGVVLCPPIGYEQLHAHRSLRHLADAVARKRLPVLRFDYHGTGDSPGSDDEPQRVATWLANIKQACAWMRRELGCDTLSLLGLRIGAALAALAATEEEGIERLVLWAPVVKGSQYVREMKAIASSSPLAAQMARDAAGAVQAAGFVLTPATCDELATIDLQRVTPRASEVLLLSRDEVAADRKLAESWSSAGLVVERRIAPGYAEMMTEPHFAQVPMQAIGTIAQWLGRAADDPDCAASLTCSARTAPGATAADISCASADPILREELCCLQDSPHLFGILTERKQAVASERPFILLVNAGSSYRIGPGRLYVRLARELARDGFRCLRLDLNGLGDSVAANSLYENDPYPATAFQDIESAFAFARNQLGAERFVLMGLCSGAYAAFQAAVQSPTNSLVESVLINPLTFFWEDGMSLEASPQANWSTWLLYLQAATDLGNWKKLLGGKSRLGVLGTLGNVARRLGLLRQPHLADKPFAAARAGCYGHPTKENLARDLQQAAAAGRHLTMIFAATDPGYFLLRCQAGRTAKRLQQTGDLTLSLIPDADHTFSVEEGRRCVIASIAAHLRSRYC
jgi:pimeloyl-ACP methyl ester carboxylesterase